MRYTLFVALALTFAACESEADKLSRLQQEASLESLRILAQDQTLADMRDSLGYDPSLHGDVAERMPCHSDASHSPLCPAYLMYTEVLDARAEARDRLLLIERDLDRLLR